MPKLSKNPTMASASKPKKPSPSPSPATAKAPRKNRSTHRRSQLSDLNSGDASAGGAGCFQFRILSTSSCSNTKCASTPRTPRSAPPGGKRKRRTNKTHGPTNAEIKKQEQAKKQADRQVEALTPEEKAAASTPASGSTPRVHLSISPEVASGAYASATPMCFAAGHHVMPGVHDRRKVRPRGILAIAGEEVSEELDAEPFRASIHWLSSPSEANGIYSTKCVHEESMNMLSSERWVDLLNDDIFVPKCSSEDAFNWRFSPNIPGLSNSPVLGDPLGSGTSASEMSETTPSPAFLAVQKTPSTGDKTSPFSLILKRASQSSRFDSSSVQQGAGNHRYGSVADPTPLSGELWPEHVSNATCSGLAMTGGRPVTKMDLVVECLEMMSLSAKPGDDDCDECSGALPSLSRELSFQFACAPTPLNSVDLSSFKRPLSDEESKAKEASFQKPVMPETLNSPSEKG